MAGSEHEPFLQTIYYERTQAMASYTRAFFRSMTTEDFIRVIEESRMSGQQKIVEELYSARVIANIVKTILGKIDKGRYVGDQVNDYIQDATLVLMQIAGQDRLNLTKSAGEIAAYICLWIEQRVKRMVRKDQRWRFSLSDSTGDIENSLDVADDPEPYLNAQPSGDFVDPETCIENKFIDSSTAPWARAGRDIIISPDFKKSERNILSIFGSSRSGEK